MFEQRTPPTCPCNPTRLVYERMKARLGPGKVGYCCWHSDLGLMRGDALKAGIGSLLLLVASAAKVRMEKG